MTLYKCAFCDEPLRFDQGACPSHLGALFASQRPIEETPAMQAGAFQFEALDDERQLREWRAEARA